MRQFAKFLCENASKMENNGNNAQISEIKMNPKTQPTNYA